MEWIIPLENKICNYCDESDKSIRFHCKECNFYGCEKCFKPKLNDSKCPFNHPLNLKIYVINYFELRILMILYRNVIFVILTHVLNKFFIMIDYVI